MSTNRYERQVRIESRRVVRQRVVVEPPDFSRPSHLPEAVRQAIAGPGNGWTEEVLVRALPDEQLIPVMRDLVKGRVIDWGSEKAVWETKKQAASPKSLFNKVVFSAVNKPSQNGDQALRIFTGELSRFSPDQSILPSPHLPEYWCKLMLGVEAHSLIEQVSKSFNKGVLETNREVRTLYRVVEERIGVLGKIVRSLENSDLSSYLVFADLMQMMEENGRERKHPIPQAVEDGMQEYERETREVFGELRAADFAAWKKLSVGWEWPQIMTAVAMLPTFRSQTTVVNTMAALESNLLGHSARLAPDQDLPLTLNPTAVGNLLRFKWGDTTLLDYPILSKQLEEKIEFSGFSVPRKHLPSAAIELFTRIGQEDGREKFVSFLSDIDTGLDVSLARNWVLTLLVLRQNVSGIEAFVEEAIGRLNGISEPVRQILLNQRTGRVWLDPTGKLHPREPGQKSQSDFPIYTSTFVVPEPISEVAVGEPAKKPVLQAEETHEETIFVKELQILRYVGEVGMIPDGAVPNFLDTLFERKSLPGEDSLLTSVDKLQRNWHGSNKRSLVYVSAMPGSLPIMEEAKQIIGLDAVHIQGEEITFIFQDKSMRVGLRGVIDKDGYLHINGGNDDELLDTRNLFLNKLALTLITQKLHLNGFVSAYSQKQNVAVMRDLRGAIADYNRNPHRQFGKLDIPQEQQDGLTPLLVEGYEYPLLAAEKIEKG